MKNYWVYSVILAATLFLSCSSFLYPSREATAKRRITPIELSASPNSIFFDLDTVFSGPVPVLEAGKPGKVQYCPIDRVTCTLPDTANVHVEVYDAVANLRLIWDKRNLPAGDYELDFRDIGLQRGMYFLRILVNEKDLPPAKKILLI